MEISADRAAELRNILKSSFKTKFYKMIVFDASSSNVQPQKHLPHLNEDRNKIIYMVPSVLQLENADGSVELHSFCLFTR